MSDGTRLTTRRAGRDTATTCPRSSTASGGCIPGGYRQPVCRAVSCCPAQGGGGVNVSPFGRRRNVIMHIIGVMPPHDRSTGVPAAAGAQPPGGTLRLWPRLSVLLRLGCPLRRSSTSSPVAPDRLLAGEAMDGAHVVGADLSGSRLREASWREAHLVDLVLDDADLRNARLVDVRVESSTASTVSAPASTWRDVELDRIALGGGESSGSPTGPRSGSAAASSTYLEPPRGDSHGCAGRGLRDRDPRLAGCPRGTDGHRGRPSDGAAARRVHPRRRRPPRRRPRGGHPRDGTRSSSAPT